jgi:hypothetical protein
MPEMINPLAAFRDGYNTVQGFRDQQTKMQAGNALAGGNYQAGANALLQGGMLGDGMDVMQAGQARDTAAADAAKLRQGEGLKAILDGGQSLLRIPAEQRAAVYQSQIVPLLQSRGVPDELLQQMGQSTFTDQELQTFVGGLGGVLQQPEWQILNMGDGGAYAVDKADPTKRQTLFEPRAPSAPAGYRWNGNNMEFIPGGPADPSVSGGLAASRRAPPRPRVGRGNSAGGLPPGFELE